MYSLPITAIQAEFSPLPLPLPLVEGRVRAGFPSPADDFSMKRQDLNDLLITHPLATFYWQVAGRSMEEAGIGDGDIIVVNRALKARTGHIVVAQVNGEFTVKYFRVRAGSIRLVPANPTFPDMVFKEGQDKELIICGVVTACIKRFVK
jgi:DNA polymerase V